MQTRNTIVKIVVSALLLYSITAFGQAQAELVRTERLAGMLQTELAKLQLENQTIKLELDSVWDDEEIRQLARERLGLVMPGEKIFYFTEDN